MTPQAFDLVTRRLHNQKLAASDGRSARDVVGWLGAVQSQDYGGAKWALGQRIAGSTDAAIERAFADGLILRTHVMRPTWHFVAPADIRWLLTLTAPRVKALLAPYDRRLELDAALLARSHAVVTRALRDGRYLTRVQLGEELAAKQIVASGQRLAHLMMHAEQDQVICSGPRRGKQFTYALLDERVPAAAPLTRDEALAALAARYFTSHGPATVHDFAWWSGLTVGDATRGVAMVRPALIQESRDELTYWFLPTRSAPPPVPPAVRLLPNYDEYGIAYRHRRALMHEDAAAAPAAGEEFAHLLLVNGQWIGSWKRSNDARACEVQVQPRRPLTKGEQRLLSKELVRYSTFLGTPVALVR